MTGFALRGGAALVASVVVAALFGALPALAAAAPPETFIDSGPSGPTNNPTPTFTFHSSEAGSTFECSIDHGTPEFTACVEPTPHLADGFYDLRVRAVNSEAEADPTPAVRSFSIDTTPPETFIDSGPSGSISLDELTSLVFTYHSSEFESTFECSLDEGIAHFEPCQPIANDIGKGSYTFRVRATDLAANVDPTPATSDFTLTEPPPVYSKTVNLEPISGVVRVRPRGKKKFSALKSETQFKVGSVIDASQGNVRLVSAKSRNGALQTADFHSGVFGVTQTPKGKPVTLLNLVSEIECAEAAPSLATTSRSKGNGLWGSGHGHYRTEGKYGSATVRGTIWFTEDRCGGTFFKVNRGVVEVRDFVTQKVLSLPKGSKYFAAAP